MTKNRKISRMALLVTISVLLGYVENLFPPPVALPGIKLGLANAVVILLVYTHQTREAVCISAMKVFLCALLFGSPVSFIYSIAGALVSLGVMLLSKRTGLFSLIGVSSLGGIFHNIAQLLCAYFFIGKGALLHMPILCISGAVCGVLTGCVAQIILKRGRGIFEQE